MNASISLGGLTLMFALFLGLSNPITMVVSPASPSAGDLIEVAVSSAPNWPVTVQFFIDGKLEFTDTLSDETDSANYQTSSQNRGETWEVKVTSGSSSDTRDGVL